MCGRSARSCMCVRNGMCGSSGLRRALSVLFVLVVSAAVTILFLSRFASSFPCSR